MPVVAGVRCVTGMRIMASACFVMKMVVLAMSNTVMVVVVLGHPLNEHLATNG